jgi:PAS domain S-box-containing protein
VNHSATSEGLNRSEALLAEAEILAELGSWEHDLVKGSILQSANLSRILGAGHMSHTVPEEFFWNMVDPQDHERVQTSIDRAMETGQPYEYQARFILPDGSQRILNVRGKPIVDADNRIFKRIGVAMDVTERAKWIDAIREGAEMYRDLVENSQALICTHGLDGKLLSLNERPAKILGYQAGELIGRRIPDLLPNDGEKLYSRYREQMVQYGSATGLLALRTRSGERRIWEYQNTLKSFGVSEPIVHGIAHDITERFEAEKRVRKSEALLSQAERLAHIGGWELELATQSLFWSKEYSRMLGMDFYSGQVPYGSGIAMIHPEDRKRAVADVDSLLAGKPEFENELRFILRDGQEKIFHSRAVSVKDKSGRMVGICGMSQDVTAQKREQEKLRRGAAILSQAEQMANCGSWEFDAASQNITPSKHLMEMFGVASEEQWRPETYWERAHPDDRDRIRQSLEDVVGQSRAFDQVSRYFAPEGGIRILHSRGMPVTAADGRVIGAMGVVQDITDRVRSEEELHKLLRKLLGLRDEDRRRLARQLHESVGQTLAALTMSMGRLRDALPGEGGPSKAFWRSCNELARQAAQETRRISYSMHPHMLDEAGLGSALRCYARDFADLSGIDVSVDVPSEFARQPREVETTIFRIVQEALTNVHRHSGSRTASVHLACEKHQLRAEVKDDGRGLPQSHSTIGTAGRIPAGVGITGMRERAEQLNGVFEIESAPGHGTVVRVSLPLAANAD